MGSLSLLLGLLLFSFITHSIFVIPFINFLYSMRFLRAKQMTKDAFGKRTPIFDKHHGDKAGVPVGGGLLVIVLVSLLFVTLLPLMRIFGVEITSIYQNVQAEVNIIFFTFLSFAILGLYDDTKKFFNFEKEVFFGLKLKHKLLLQVILSIIIASLLYFQLGISLLHVPFLGTLQLGWLYIPFASFVIVAFTNAVNITDGLDGLAAGVLMIALFGLWFLSASILDIPLSLFIALWLGGLISFLYFNVFPARVFMGDVGALSFGATLAVIGLILGKSIAVGVIGLIFVVEIFTSLTQLLSKRFRGKKIYTAAPFHLFLQEYGWQEPKIVQRAWLAQIVLTLFGVWLASI